MGSLVSFSSKALLKMLLVSPAYSPEGTIELVLEGISLKGLGLVVLVPLPVEWLKCKSISMPTGGEASDAVDPLTVGVCTLGSPGGD